MSSGTILDVNAEPCKTYHVTSFCQRHCIARTRRDTSMAFRRPDSPEALTVAEASCVLGVSEQTTRRMIDSGELHSAWCTLGRQRRVLREVVEAYARGEVYGVAA